MKRASKPQDIPAASPALEAANRKVHDQIVARCCNVSPTVGEDGRLSTPCPCEVGKDYPVKQVSFDNIHGGTELAAVRARAKVVARWWDYETGWRFTGEVVTLAETAISRFTKEPIALPTCVRFGQFDLRK